MTVLTLNKNRRIIFTEQLPQWVVNINLAVYQVMIINKHSLAPSTTQILAAATQLAAKYRRPSTGTEHVLMALCTDPEFVAFIGDKIMFDQELIHADIEQYMQPDDGPLAGNALRLTPRLTQVLDITAEITRELGSPSIEPEHLLLGILKEGNSVTAQVLNKNGIYFHPLVSCLDGSNDGSERVEAAVGMNAR